VSGTVRERLGVCVYIWLHVVCCVTCCGTAIVDRSYVRPKRPMCVAKEIYMYGKRDPYVWQKCCSSVIDCAIV